jgi:predicted alpha/beta superfamily hydrolase
MRVATTLLLLLFPALVPDRVLGQGRYESAVDIGQVDSLQSAALDEARPFLVYTPPSYEGSVEAGQRYPVLYLLDGDAHFHSVTGLIQALGTGVNGTYVLPEMIVVAIPNTNRTRDLTPTNTMLGFTGDTVPAFEASGGNPAFFEFLTDELIPHIDAAYRTMPYRVFVGHSFGGITTLNALYEIPEAFDAYVAIDPSLWWDRQVLLKKARDYFETARLEGKALYVAQANTFNPDTTVNLHADAISRFDAVMRAYDRSGIRYDFRYYGEDDHGSVPLIAEYDALRFIFDGYKVPLARALDDPGLLLEHFEDVSRRFGDGFSPPPGMIAMLASFAAGQDPDHALEFADIGEGLYPADHNWAEVRGDVAAAAGDTDEARAYYEEALAKSDGAEHVQAKLDGLESGG